MLVVGVQGVLVDAVVNSRVFVVQEAEDVLFLCFITLGCIHIGLYKVCSSLGLVQHRDERLLRHSWLAWIRV